MRTSKWMAGVLALGLIFGLMTVPAIAEKEPIKIGAIVELTGEAAEMGIENQYTIEVAESLLNASGGIEGYPVKVVIVDGGSDPAVFATKAHRLIDNEKVIAGIGGNDISFATAAGEVFAKSEVPYADIGGTTPTIPLISDFMFMAPGPDNDQGRAVAKYVVEKLGYNTFAIFTQHENARVRFWLRALLCLVELLKVFAYQPDQLLGLTFRDLPSRMLLDGAHRAFKGDLQRLLRSSLPQSMGVFVQRQVELCIHGIKTLYPPGTVTHPSDIYPSEQALQLPFAPFPNMGSFHAIRAQD